MQRPLRYRALDPDCSPDASPGFAARIAIAQLVNVSSRTAVFSSCTVHLTAAQQSFNQIETTRFQMYARCCVHLRGLPAPTKALKIPWSTTAQRGITLSAILPQITASTLPSLRNDYVSIGGTGNLFSPLPVPLRCRKRGICSKSRHLHRIISIQAIAPTLSRKVRVLVFKAARHGPSLLLVTLSTYTQHSVHPIFQRAAAASASACSSGGLITPCRSIGSGKGDASTLHRRLELNTGALTKPALLGAAK
jgi:hypothetical protein